MITSIQQTHQQKFEGIETKEAETHSCCDVWPKIPGLVLEWVSGQVRLKEGVIYTRAGETLMLFWLENYRNTVRFFGLIPKRHSIIDPSKFEPSFFLSQNLSLLGCAEYPRQFGLFAHL